MNKPRQLTETELDFVRTRLEKLFKAFSKSNTNEDSSGSGDRKSKVKNDKEEHEDASTQSTPQVEKLISSLCGLSKRNWSKVNYGGIRSHFRKTSVGKPLKIRGSILCLSSVSPCIDLPDSPDKLELEISDGAGERVKIFPIVNDKLITKVQSLFDVYQCIDFFGTVIPDGGDGEKVRPDYRFYLFDVEPSDDPLQIVQATAREIEEAKRLVDGFMTTPGAILKHVKSKLVEIMGIKGLEHVPELDQSLEFMILQALSDGCDSSRSLSYKLHSLAIGSPAVGKKLLTEAAHILNPVCTEGQPAKLTVADIAGTAINRDGKWTSEPGLIPMAHRGTFAVQDFHHVAKKDLLMGAFSMAMEDGKVIDSSAAKKKHHALTSIHIDMNRKSHVQLAGMSNETSPRKHLADIGVTMNVLSRFDYVVEIPRDSVRQTEIALQMHSGIQVTSNGPVNGKQNMKARELQVLVAFLRSEHSKIDIPDELMTSAVRDTHEALLKTYRDASGNESLLSDYQTRLANSIHKLVAAVARGNARNVANESDVEVAHKYAETKMKFLASLNPSDVQPNMNGDRELGKVAKRRLFIREAFGGTTTTVVAVHQAVNDRHDTKVSESTIRRDLEEVGKSQRHGVFLVGEVPKCQNDYAK